MRAKHLARKVVRPSRVLGTAASACRKSDHEQQLVAGVVAELPDGHETGYEESFKHDEQHNNDGTVEQMDTLGEWNRVNVDSATIIESGPLGVTEQKSLHLRSLK